MQIKYFALSFFIFGFLTNPSNGQALYQAGPTNFPLLNSYAPNLIGFAPADYVFSSYSVGGFKFQGPAPPAEESEENEEGKEEGGSGEDKESGGEEKGAENEGKSDQGTENNENGGKGGKKLIQVQLPLFPAFPVPAAIGPAVQISTSPSNGNGGKEADEAKNGNNKNNEKDEGGDNDNDEKKGGGEGKMRKKKFNLTKRYPNFKLENF